jgi:hypothetical protein
LSGKDNQCHGILENGKGDAANGTWHTNFHSLHSTSSPSTSTAHVTATMMKNRWVDLDRSDTRNDFLWAQGRVHGWIGIRVRPSVLLSLESSLTALQLADAWPTLWRDLNPKREYSPAVPVYALKRSIDPYVPSSPILLLLLATH